MLNRILAQRISDFQFQHREDEQGEYAAAASEFLNNLNAELNGEAEQKPCEVGE